MMKRLRLGWLLIASVAFSACAGERTLAPSVAQIANTSLHADAFLWRDFMPISPPDGRPLIAVIRIQSGDSTPIASDLTADSAWVYNGAAVWATAVVETQPREPGAAFFEVRASGGPKWGPGIDVDVVVRVRDTAGDAVLIQTPRRMIIRTD